jgi:hypothetical protein
MQSEAGVACTLPIAAAVTAVELFAPSTVLQPDGSLVGAAYWPLTSSAIAPGATPR